MVRLFKYYVPHAVLFLGLIDCVLLSLTGELGWSLRAFQIGMDRARLLVAVSLAIIALAFLDFLLPGLILLQTLRVVIWPEGAR